MKLATVSISTPRIITRVPSPLKLASSYSANAIGRKKIHKHKPEGDQLSDVRQQQSFTEKGSQRIPGCLCGARVSKVCDSNKLLIAMPDFRVLMERVADEFGCDHHGALAFPCDEELFEQILMTCFARQQMIDSKNSKKLTW